MIEVEIWKPIEGFPHHEVSNYENFAHALKLGLYFQAEERNNQAKLKKKDVIEIRELGKQSIYHRIIAERFGVSRGNISNIIKGSQWSHI